MQRLFLITGCSGGGKSSLLAELNRRGHGTVEEPGRRIVAQERAGSGNALPWNDMAAFARRALTMAKQDFAAAAATPGLVFFDRGLVDAAVALKASTGAPLERTLDGMPRYADTVFLAPPWPEIFANDQDRKHSFGVAKDEFDRIEAALLALRYDVSILPKESVAQRADFVLTSAL